MPERNIGFKVDDEFYKEIKVRIAKKGITLKEYVVNLIKEDLEKNK